MNDQNYEWPELWTTRTMNAQNYELLELWMIGIMNNHNKERPKLYKKKHAHYEWP